MLNAQFHLSSSLFGSNSFDSYLYCDCWSMWAQNYNSPPCTLRSRSWRVHQRQHRTKSRVNVNTVHHNRHLWLVQVGIKFKYNNDSSLCLHSLSCLPLLPCFYTEYHSFHHCQFHCINRNSHPLQEGIVSICLSYTHPLLVIMQTNIKYQFTKLAHLAFTFTRGLLHPHRTLQTI